MRITDLQVDGFGVWTGLAMSGLSDQVNVIYGPNEAGKTTLMQFIRTALYGFSPERRDRYLPPVRPGRPGGSLRVVDRAGSLLIGRHADGLDGEERLQLLDAHGKTRDESRLAELLGDIDEPVFSNVFAFGLREIQELNMLSDTDAAHLLYDLTLGLDHVSLAEILQGLSSSRARLIPADERPGVVSQLIAQRERLQSEIAVLGSATDRYTTLRDEQRRLQPAIADLEAQRAAINRRLQLLELAGALSDRWRRRSTLVGKLAKAPGLDDRPADALARWERVSGRLAARQTLRGKIKQRRHELTQQIQRLKINDALCRQAPRLEALNEQQQWINSLATHIAQHEEQIAGLELEREAVGQHLQVANKKGSQPQQPPRLNALRPIAKSIGEARRKLQAHRAQIAAHREKADDLTRQLTAALSSKGQKDLRATMDKSGQLVSQLRRRVQLDERLDQMTRHEADLQEQSHALLDQQLAPGWMIGLLGGGFVLGAVLLLAGLFLPNAVTGYLGWPLAGIGAAGMGFAALKKWHTEYSAARQLDQCHNQLTVLRDQLTQAKQDRDDLDALLPKGGGPLVSRLQTAEEQMAELEEFLPLDAQREAAVKDARLLNAQLKAAKGDVAKARERWRQALKSAGLPDDLAPRQLKSFNKSSRQSREIGQRLEGLYSQLTERQAEYDVLKCRILQLAADIGLTLPAGDPLTQLRQMLVQLRDQEQLVKQRDDLRKGLIKLRRSSRHCTRAIVGLNQKRAAILREVAAADDEGLRQLATAQEEARRLHAEHDSLASEITALLMGKCREEDLSPYFATGTDLEKLGRKLTADIDAVNTQLQERFERRGELNQQLKALVEDRTVAQKQLELALVEKRLSEATDRWRVLAVCQMALESVRRLYESQRQPEALREASVYLQRLTGGRYTRVWTPLDQHVLRVDDADGNALSVEVLSRGTREQVFLALRLALIVSYARRGVHLPLVLDDVLVNFDIIRAKAAATALCDFAKSGYQVLIFTCHEHIAKLFRSLDAEVRTLPDNSRPRADLVEVEKPIKRKAPPPEPVLIVEPEPEPAIVLAPEPEVELAPEPEQELKVVDVPLPPAPAPLVFAQTPVVFVEPAPLVAAPLPEPVVEKPKRRLRPPRREPAHVAPPPNTRRLVPWSQQWDAEEFAGELTDRVRRPEPAAVSNYEETLDVQFDDDNGHVLPLQSAEHGN